MKLKETFERGTGIAAASALALGCLVVVFPFLTSLLWAMILAYSTWPIFMRLETLLHGSRTFAASIMTLAIAVVLIVPFAVVVASVADDTAGVVAKARTVFAEGLPAAPVWVASLPLVGTEFHDYWNELAADRARVLDMVQGFVEPAARFAIAAGGTFGKGLVELALSVFIAFFLYRNGEAASQRLRVLLSKFTERGEHLIQVAAATVRGVVYGVIGTALAQGLLAGIGFWISGIPGALFLGLLTFVASLIPGAPPLIWAPAALWLAWKGDFAWAAFLGIWGLVIVSGVDNILKPMLISRTSALPFVLVFLGAVGGVLGFGLVGIFLGPTLLAVAFNLLEDWTEGEARKADPVAENDGLPT